MQQPSIKRVYIPEEALYDDGEDDTTYSDSDEYESETDDSYSNDGDAADAADAVIDGQDLDNETVVSCDTEGTYDTYTSYTTDASTVAPPHQHVRGHRATPASVAASIASYGEDSDTEVDELDINEIISSIDPEKHHNLHSLSMARVDQIKQEVLYELNIPPEKHPTYLTKLKDYMLVETLDQLKAGRYIRWILLTKNNHMRLDEGALVFTIFERKDVDFLYCQKISRNFNRKFMLRFDRCIIFQKLKIDELLILNAMNYVDDK